ncbi:MAG: DUF4442 domain-containing protein [Deltaproteobacteria bacterium]|nr:DUF4442 domain-containing protein [Deltaproteobacteria bacterium]MBM4323687.1 DUF4442 domain-containing protein [Deltaproteobacteria bacterium]
MDFQFDQKKLKHFQWILKNRLLFKMAMFFQVPLDFMAGIRLRELNEESCKVSVPYRWLNKNPFRSTFWAVLGMAAELSTGALVMMYTYKLDPSVAIIVGDCSGEFIAKAKDLTTFVCNDGKAIAKTVIKAIETGEPQEVLCKAVGYSKSGEEVARFTFTWKMKRRGA